MIAIAPDKKKRARENHGALIGLGRRIAGLGGELAAPSIAIVSGMTAHEDLVTLLLTIAMQ